MRRREGLLAWVLEIHWGEGGAADFLGLAWVRVKEVLFDGAEELMLDGDVSVVVVRFCFAAGGLKLVGHQGMNALEKRTLYLSSVTGLGPWPVSDCIA